MSCSGSTKTPSGTSTQATSSSFSTSFPTWELLRLAASSRALAQAWLDKTDQNANRFAPQARRVASIPIVYTAAAAVMSGVAPEIPERRAMAGHQRRSRRVSLWRCPLSCVCTSVSRSGRAPAPRLKSPAPFSLPGARPGTYQVIGAEVAPWLAGILRSLNFLKMEDNHRIEIPLSDFKQEYRRDRVAHQIEYFSRQARKAERQERRYGAVGWICGVLATLIAVACLSGGLQWLADHGVSGRQWLAFLMSSLFEVATMAGAFASMKDCARRRRRYRELSDALRRWDTQLEALNTWNSVLRVVERIERALIVELFEWRSLVLGAVSHKG